MKPFSASCSLVLSSSTPLSLCISALYSILKQPLSSSSSPSSSPPPPQLLSLKTEQMQPGRTASMFPCSLIQLSGCSSPLKPLHSSLHHPLFHPLLNFPQLTLFFFFVFFSSSFSFFHHIFYSLVNSLTSLMCFLPPTSYLPSFHAFFLPPGFILVHACLLYIPHPC